MKIAVIGTGYVGLVQGAGLASAGHDIVCVDEDETKVEALRRGQIPFYEPGLRDMVSANAGRLQFTTDTVAARDAEIVFLCVGTPSANDGSADLSQLVAAARSVRGRCGLVVVKSTVPPGTTLGVVEPEVRPMLVASNPEFLKEGDAVRDFVYPDRIVIGATAPKAFELLRQLYAPFVRTGAPVLEMDPTSAELSKYASNAMLGTRISLMNELAAVADSVGGNIDAVRRVVGADKRIGSSFLFPGVGFGGSCLPKDLAALAFTARRANIEPHVLQASLSANVAARRRFLDKVLCHFGDVRGHTIALWGLAFKPGTDDIRQAPSMYFVDGLRGAVIRAHDPKVSVEKAVRVLEDRARWCPTAFSALEGAEALLVVTEWPEYRGVDLAAVRARMAAGVLFDGRNVFDPAVARAAGFRYYGVGRGAVL